MALFQFILILMAAVLVSSVLAQFIPRVSLPLVQIVLGAVMFLAWPADLHATVEPELFLVLFIAPLLFDESRRISTTSIWKSKAGIASLVVGLVIVTLLAVGFALHWLIPSIPLAAAFALGAALGPTDAVAVASLSADIKLSSRQKTLLSGEALFNDASGVVSYQFAIAAAVTGAFSMMDATITFLITFLGGLGLGLLLGFLVRLGTKAVRALGYESTVEHVLAEIVTPFAIYLIAEAIGVSGIIAVVTAGLFMTVFPDRTTPSTARINIVSSSVWEVVVFLINGIVFVMLGMQLPLAATTSWTSSSISAPVIVAAVAAVTAIVMVIRFLWVLAMDAVHSQSKTAQQARLAHAIAQRRQIVVEPDQEPEGQDALDGQQPVSVTDALVAVATNDVAEPALQAQPKVLDSTADHPWRVSPRDALVTTLSGPKGAVTLSIVLTLPYLLASGEPFPHRDLLVFMASWVIIITLLLANFVVPLLAPKEEQEEDETGLHELRIKIFGQVITELRRQRTPENTPATRVVVRRYRDQIAHFREANTSSKTLNKLRLEVLDEQERCIVRLLRSGLVSKRVAEVARKRNERSRNLLSKRRVGRKMVRNPWRHPTAALVLTSRRAAGRIAEGKVTPELRNDLNLLSIDLERCAISYLDNYIDSNDKELVRAARLLLEEHETNLSSYEARLESGDGTATVVRKMINPLSRFKTAAEYELALKYLPEVEAEGLRLELEAIQQMREDGAISWRTARDLREEVYLMQMDISA